VAERATGGDADCAAAPSVRTLPAESIRAQLTIDAGQVLCAAVATGTTDVSWHQFTDTRDALWARR
jgi:hypothetical protein